MKLLCFATICFIVISSCTSSKLLRTYPGDSSPPSETARLHRFAGESRDHSSGHCFLKLRIKEFDGKKPGGSYETLEFFPGAHTVTVDFQPIYRFGQQIYPQYPITINFAAEEGGEYIFSCGMRRSGKWTAEILDKATQVKVSY